jgi:hypothetical protein
VEQRAFIHRAPLLGIAQQRFDLRRKGQAAVVNAVVQRLDADAIAHQPQFAPPRIPQPEREHAAEPRDAVNAPLFKRMENHFAVAVVRFPSITAGLLQLDAEFRMIVDFAVVRQPQRTIGVRHRLPRSRG